MHRVSTGYILNPCITMKYLLIGLFLLPIALMAQNDWALPSNAFCAKSYARCYSFKTDSFSKNQIVTGFDTIRIKVQEKLVWNELIHLPVFDTVLLEIPVDKATRMANLPDQYEVVRQYKPSTTCFSRWIPNTYSTRVNHSAPCIFWSNVELPLELRLRFLPTLTLKSTAHQVRVDTTDVLVIKQVIERSPIVLKVEERPEIYETIIIPTAPNLVWHKWQEDNTEVKIHEVTVGEIQEALKRKGYYQGKINNKMDKRTIKAISRYRMVIGLPAHGDGELFKALGLNY
jgi:hypothetical protein